MSAWYNLSVLIKCTPNTPFSRTVFVLVAVLGLLVVTGCQFAILTPQPTATMTPLVGDGNAPVLGMATPTTAPEIYLTPIPPTSTLTPSPTPTPVIHSIESGDTLFGIALDYGVDVDALMRANGIAEDDILRIGQVLIIPLDEEELATESSIHLPVGRMILPTHTPLPINLGEAGSVLYDTPVGGVWCMGKVINTLDVPVTNIQVEITLLAPDETPILTAMTLAPADYLSPGETAPFSMLIPDPPDGVHSSVAQILRAEEISAITSSFVPLTVTESEGGVNGPQFRVRGKLVNESGYNVMRLTTVVTIYDADGHVLGYRQVVQSDEEPLAAGSTQPFDISVTPHGVQSPTDFSVISWAVIQ